MAHQVITHGPLMADRPTEAGILVIEETIQIKVQTADSPPLGPIPITMSPRIVVEGAVSAIFNGLHPGLKVAVDSIALLPCTGTSRRLPLPCHRLKVIYSPLGLAKTGAFSELRTRISKEKMTGHRRHRKAETP